MALRTLSVFSGVGWLDAGFHLGLDALGIGSRTVCYVERDAYAAAVLVARMEDASLDIAPVWDNLATFDGRPWRGRVDCLIGGPPCQPYSCAGKQRGHDDERSHGADGDGPLEHLARVIGEVQPGLVFLENVPNWVRGGWFRRFGEAVSGLGFRWRPPLFLRASDVGAPHKRERVFLLAHCEDGERFGESTAIGAGRESRASGSGDELAESTERGFGELRESSRRNGFADGGDGGVDDATGARQHKTRRGQPAEPRRRQRLSGDGRGGMVYPKRLSGGEQEPQRGGITEPPDGDGGNVAFFPPGPNGDWSGIAAELWPAIAPQTQSSILRMADGSAHLLDDCRADRLRCIGNGVVALQAACAAALLIGEVNDET